MQSASLANQPTRSVSWTGRILSALVVVFMLFDGAIHILKPAPVVQAFTRLGYPLSTSVGLGILELVFTILYVIPRTAALGALLLTGYLGGAVATQLRAGSGGFETIFPVLVGAIVWAGLALRDARVRAFITG